MVPHIRHNLSEKTAHGHNSQGLEPRLCEQLDHVHSVVWLHDTLCEAAVTGEPGKGNCVTSGVPDVVLPLLSKGDMALISPFPCFAALFTCC